MHSRSSNRVPIDIPVSLSYANHYIAGHMLNLGSTGFGVEVTQTPIHKQIYLANFKLVDSKRYKILASPVWCNPVANGKYHAGFEFYGTDADIHRELSDYVGELWLKNRIGSLGQ